MRSPQVDTGSIHASGSRNRPTRPDRSDGLRCGRWGAVRSATARTGGVFLWDVQVTSTLRGQGRRRTVHLFNTSRTHTKWQHNARIASLQVRLQERNGVGQGLLHHGGDVRVRRVEQHREAVVRLREDPARSARTTRAGHRPSVVSARPPPRRPELIPAAGHTHLTWCSTFFSVKIVSLALAHFGGKMVSSCRSTPPPPPRPSSSAW